MFLIELMHSLIKIENCQFINNTCQYFFAVSGLKEKVNLSFSSNLWINNSLIRLFFGEYMIFYSFENTFLRNEIDERLWTISSSDIQMINTFVENNTGGTGFLFSAYHTPNLRMINFTVNTY